MVRLRLWDMSTGPETRLVGHIAKGIIKRWPLAWVTKIHGGSYQSAGIPDLLVVVEGLMIGLEVKAQRPGETETHARKRATELQLANIEAIRRAGGIAEVVLTVEEAVKQIELALVLHLGVTSRPCDPRISPHDKES